MRCILPVVTSAGGIERFKKINMSMNATLEERFNRRVRKGSETECWDWIGGIDKDGYGVLQFNKVVLRTHRVSYIIHVGEIPTGLVLDHLCRNRRCVNPSHLEACSIGENVRRGISIVPKCRNGHPYTDYWITKQGWRRCRVCKRAAKKRTKSRKVDNIL